MKLIIAALALAIVAMPASAEPDYHSANYWLPKCRGTHGAAEKVMCFGYIRGFVEAEELLARPPRYCDPHGVTYGQFIRIVIAHADKHPNKTHLPFDRFVLAALVEAFPCPARTP